MRAASFALLPAVLLAATLAAAGPEAHLFRVDARAAPVLTTLLEVAQPRRVADATAPCAALSGDALFDCLGDALEKPGALAVALPFPEQNAVFSVAQGRADTPLVFESASRWGERAGAPGVGTAWLILVDASSTMASRFDDAKEIARGFLDALRPNDVADVVLFNDLGVFLETRWAADKGRAVSALAGVPRVWTEQQPTRPLAAVVEAAVDGAYRELFTSGVSAPLHQAAVLISNAEHGDPGVGAAGAARIRERLSRGRFTGTPKMPLPLVSVWLPGSSAPPPEARQFMEGVANPELGGLFTAVRPGRKGRAAGIVSAVRSRFDKMVLVQWKLTCTVIGPTQTWKLAFANTTPPIAGDETFKDAPYNGPGPQPCKK